VDDWSESDLAWELADVISPLLADRDRAQLYATIGSGESYTAIDTVLQTMAHQSLPIATELVIKLTNWLDAYPGNNDAPRLRELLHAIKSLRSCALDQPRDPADAAVRETLAAGAHTGGADLPYR
jgi:hypothetical protein